MKKLSLLFLIILSSCFNNENKNISSIESDSNKKTDNIKLDVTNKEKEEIIELDTITETKILFYGKLKRNFTLNKFEEVFGKIDSIKNYDYEEELCNYYFENCNESNLKEIKFLFKNGSKFANFKQEVVIDSFKFSAPDQFFKYNNLKFDSTTTIESLKKIFPKSFKNLDYIFLDNKNLKTISLQLKDTPEEKLLLFFDNDKLYMIQWWQPC